MNIIIVIISASITMLIFDKLNSKYDFFKDIQSKINDLNEKKEHRLRISSYILILIIYGIMQRVNMNLIVQVLILDYCFHLERLALKIIQMNNFNII